MKIAIVEDHEFWRSALVDLIGRSEIAEVTIVASNGLQFLEEIRNAQRESLPELVITDLTMPGMGGFQVAAWLREQLPETRMIVLSLCLQQPDVIRLLKIGVKGCLDKSCASEALVPAIEAVSNGEYYFSTLWGEQHNGPCDSPPIKESTFEAVEKWNLLKTQEREFFLLCCSHFGVSSRIALVKLAVQNKMLHFQ